MPRRPAPLPPQLGEAFRTSRARGEGVTERRLRAGDLATPFRGVRARRAPAQEPADDAPFALDRAQRDAVLRTARAAALVLPPHAFLAGRSALAARALPVRHGPLLEVAVFSPHRAPRRSGIAGRRIDPRLAHVEMVEGLRVASAASAWAMLADELSVRELIVLGDAIVRIPRDHTGRKRPDRALATIDQLERAAAAGRRRGIHHLRRALDEVCTESASPLETEFRLDAAAAGLPPGELDREVCDAADRRLGISEFVYPEWRVVAEIEGDHHRTSRRQWERDLAKYAAYADAGWEVVRLTGAQVRRGTAVPHLARALTRRSRAGFGGRSTSESASDSGVD